jgi:hypothetical protein
MSQERVGRAIQKLLFILALCLRLYQRILTRDHRRGEIAILLVHLLKIVKLLSHYLLSCYRIFVLEVLCIIIR